MEQKVSEEQASQALLNLVTNPNGDEAPPVSEPPAEAPAETVPEEKPAEQPEEPVQAAAPEGDDVESLRKRLEKANADIETERRVGRDRADAIQRRAAQNEQVLRERFLKKATVADRAHKILKATRSQAGVPETEVDDLIREIEGTMNPSSPSYSPPPVAVEDQTMILNGFLNEHGMTQEEADNFSKWMRSDALTALSPVEQAVAPRDLDAFLRIAHGRYRESQNEQNKQQQREAAIGAVRSVQRTQREAAKAATTSAAAPRKQPTGPKSIDVKSLTKNDVSALLRASVEENY